MGGPNGILSVVGLHCAGDESRACCNAPAYGQTVVVTGRLEREHDSWGNGSGLWQLASASVCQEAQARGP